MLNPNLRKPDESGQSSNSGFFNSVVHLCYLLAAQVAALLKPELRVLLEDIRTRLDDLSDLLHLPKPLMKIEDVAKTLNVSQRKVEQIIQRGDLKPLWIDGQRRFHPDAIDAYLRKCGRRPRRGRQ